jgi:rRNA processing protein Gar1
MKTLGVVQDITRKGELLVRAGRLTVRRGPVFDGRKRKIGRIKRAFGPVESPYVLVIPDVNLNLTSVLNQKIFVR